MIMLQNISISRLRFLFSAVSVYITASSRRTTIKTNPKVFLLNKEWPLSLTSPSRDNTVLKLVEQVKKEMLNLK